MALAHDSARGGPPDGPGVVTLAPQPAQLGRYRLLAPLGSGGMAAVYLGHPIDEVERFVAIKVMLPHLARDQRFAAMFLDESRIACQVASPHVVRSYDYGSEQGSLYLVMDFVRGVSLRELMLSVHEAGERLPLPVAAAIVLDAAEGLAAAHATRAHDGTLLGIVHRDVSPHNVLVGLDGRARVSDFGVAYAVDRLSRTTTGGVKGKPGYVSPEHFDSERVDQRSDVFCLGVVAWECFAGQTLFRAAHPLAQLRQVLTAEIPRVDSLYAEAGEPVADAIARALVRDLGSRTATMKLFAEELRAAAQASFGVAPPEEVRATLERYCASELGEIERCIQQARPHSEPAPSLFRRRARRYVPWGFALFSTIALAVASTSHGGRAVGAEGAPRSQDVMTRAARAPEPQVDEAPVPGEPRAPADLFGAPPEQELTAPELPAKRAPVVKGAKSARRPARVVRAAKKAPRRPAVVRKREASESGSPLLDVHAFERGRKQRP